VETVEIGSEVYCVEQRRTGYTIKNVSTGKWYGPYPSHRGAYDIVEALRAEARRIALTAPGAKEKRRKRGVYRLVESDPMLRVLRRVLPRTGEIARNTKKSQQHMLDWLDGRIASAASDPRVHAELQKSPGQRRTTRATTAISTKGAGTREQVIELWNALALAGIPSRARASRIAELLGIEARHVRRLRKQ
jgi:hypothetical protein